MPIYGPEYSVNQVVAVLQANLPAEFNLMDALWGDGIVLDDVPNGNYFKVRNPAALDAGERAMLVYCTGTDPIQIDSVSNTPGRRVAEDLITVEYQIKDTANEDPVKTQSRVFRSATAIERVLAIKNVTLGGTVTKVSRRERIVYDAQSGDEGGEFIRIAKIPFAVQVYEALP